MKHILSSEQFTREELEEIFDLAEKMCRVLEADEHLAEEYAVMLSYFKRNFYNLE